MTTNRIAHPSLDERRARGLGARDRVALDAHASWAPASDRPDPIGLLEAQNITREPDLVPVRHGRMMVSPFTFYRGGATIMAADLRDTPTAGLTVQLCGDAHLSNFGAFASPERQLLFDLNDFDETYPGPFEYDVKRLAASFTIAARNNGFDEADAHSVTARVITAYRRAMRDFAQMRTLDVWYAHLGEDDILAAARKVAKGKGKKVAKELKLAERTLAKARTRDSLHALSKLTRLVDGRPRIVGRPPMVVPLEEVAQARGLTADEMMDAIRRLFREYRATLQPDRRHVLEQFEIVDIASKVVGVGSVGTRAFILLLQGRDQRDPLFLQVKEATASVLEEHLPGRPSDHPGKRVVDGQRLMQATSDIFLGWVRGVEEDRYFYVRQLRDMKGSALVEDMSPRGMALYAGVCGWTLARAHARSGDPVAIAAYLGDSDDFDRVTVEFSMRYADQNERDYREFIKAIESGRLEASPGC